MCKSSRQRDQSALGVGGDWYSGTPHRKIPGRTGAGPGGAGPSVGAEPAPRAFAALRRVVSRELWCGPRPPTGRGALLDLRSGHPEG